ncbi:MAG TPA: hypothetical protein VE913_03450, partial [Longimicrobium sp.]|nr:hypothetical protein [Longimicrobium sp.]
REWDETGTFLVLHCTVARSVRRGGGVFRTHGFSAKRSARKHIGIRTTLPAQLPSPDLNRFMAHHSAPLRLILL